MKLFPAVDLKDGKAVRLRQGKADESTIFSDDPVAMALKWQEQGASYLHLIDLDGAFCGNSANAEIVSEIAKVLSIPIQLGGGIRNEEVAKRWIDLGVQRLIVGTMALEEPKRFYELCLQFPKQIGLSLDAVGNSLKTRGWLVDSEQNLDDIVSAMASKKEGSIGAAFSEAAFLIYTDIERDGTGLGVNREKLAHLSKTSPVPVIAAGGMSTLQDVKDLYPLSKEGNLEGAIIGQALYTGTIDLVESLEWIKLQD